MQGKAFVFKLHRQNFTKSNWNPIMSWQLGIGVNQRRLRVPFPWNQLWLVERVMCYSLNTYLGISATTSTQEVLRSVQLSFLHTSAINCCLSKVKVCYGIGPECHYDHVSEHVPSRTHSPTHPQTHTFLTFPRPGKQRSHYTDTHTHVIGGIYHPCWQRTCSDHQCRQTT